MYTFDDLVACIVAITETPDVMFTIAGQDSELAELIEDIIDRHGS